MPAAEFLQHWFAASGDGILQTDSQGLILLANDAARRMLGLEPGVRLEIPLGPSGELEDGQREIELLPATGEPRWCDVRVHAYVGVDRQRRCIVVLHDVTDRRRAERVLRDREQQLRLALEGGSVGLWDWHFPTGTLVVSDRWLSMLGLDPLGPAPTLESWHELVRPDDRPKLERLVREVILNPAGREFEVEVRARHRAGHEVWILDKGAVVERAADGSPVRIAGTHVDITARKRAEDLRHAAELAVRESEARFRAVIEASPVPFILGDAVGQLVYINPACVSTFGFEHCEIPTHVEWWLKAYPDPEYRGWVAQAWEKRLAVSLAESRPFVPMEVIIRCKDGTDRNVIAHAVRLDGLARVTHMVVLFDVTEMLRLEHRVLEAVSLEQHRLGMDLHDGLGQQLTGLSLLLAAASRDVDRRGPAVLAEDLSQLSALVSQCIGTARSIAHGLSPIEPGKAGFERALRRLAQSDRSIGQIQIRFDLQALERVDLDARIAESVYRIVQEALSNAVKHAAASEVRVTASVSEGTLTMQISDNGCGLSVNRRSDGLGLHIMRYRARALGGRLEIDKAEPQGTAVALVCPLVRGRTAVAETL